MMLRVPLLSCSSCDLEFASPGWSKEIYGQNPIVGGPLYRHHNTIEALLIQPLLHSFIGEVVPQMA